MTMPERITPLPQLERSDRSEAEKAIFLKDVTLWREHAANEKSLNYTATLPKIVGYVPKGERGFFSTAVQKRRQWYVHTQEDMHDELERSRLHLLRKEMRETLQLVDEDNAFLCYPALNIESYYLNKHSVKAGSVIGEALEPHIEPPFYLVCDTASTNFYMGPACARYSGLMDGSLDLEHSGPFTVVSAPPWAIVRVGPWTVHGSPTVTKDTERTIMLLNPSVYDG